MQFLQKLVVLLNKSFGTYNIKGIEVEPTYWMALAIVILVFLLLFTLARLRFLYIHWNLSGTSLSFLFYGFLLALILEGFLIISGRTFFTATLGWNDAPKPIGTFIDMGRNRIANVLGKETIVPSSVAKEPLNAKSVITDYFNLSGSEAKQVKSQICTP